MSNDKDKSESKQTNQTNQANQANQTNIERLPNKFNPTVIEYIEKINLKLLFNKDDCSGFFQYPNGTHRKARTEEILQFYVLLEVQNKTENKASNPPQPMIIK